MAVKSACVCVWIKKGRADTILATITLLRTILAGNSGATTRTSLERYQIQNHKAIAATAATVSEAMIMGDDQA